MNLFMRHFSPQTHHRIARMICQRVNIPIRKVFARDRHRDYCVTRQIISYVLHHHYKYKLSYIGKMFNLDHSTIYHGCKEVATQMQVNHAFFEKVSGIVDYVTTKVQKPKQKQPSTEY